MELIDTRVDTLTGKMTLEQKLNLMDGDTPFWLGFGEMMVGYNTHPYPAGRIPELDIQGIQFIDGPRGIVMRGATTFPVSMARGATWDTELEEKAGEMETVLLQLPVSDIAYYDETVQDFVVEPIEYEVFVGRHSLDGNGLKAKFRVEE